MTKYSDNNSKDEDISLTVSNVSKKSEFSTVYLVFYKRKGGGVFWMYLTNYYITLFRK